MPDAFEALTESGEQRLEPLLRKALGEFIKGNMSGFADATEEASGLIVEAQTFADLWGRRSVVETLRLGKEPRARIQFGKGAPSFTRAIDALTKGNPYLLPSKGFVEEAYASKVLPHSLDMQKSIQDRVDQLVSKSLSEGTGELNAAKALADSQEWTQGYASTVYRTNTSNAFAAGQWAEADQPGFREVFPAFRYDATRDGDTRPNHRAADGLIASVSDPIWDQLAPPLGFNCRCVLVNMTESQLRRAGLIDGDGNVKPRIPPKTAAGEAFPDPGFVKRSRPDRAMYGSA